MINKIIHFDIFFDFWPKVKFSHQYWEFKKNKVFSIFSTKNSSKLSNFSRGWYCTYNYPQYLISAWLVKIWRKSRLIPRSFPPTYPFLAVKEKSNRSVILRGSYCDDNKLQDWISAQLVKNWKCSGADRKTDRHLDHISWR